MRWSAGCEWTAPCRLGWTQDPSDVSRFTTQGTRACDGARVGCLRQRPLTRAALCGVGSSVSVSTDPTCDAWCDPQLRELWRSASSSSAPSRIGQRSCVRPRPTARASKPAGKAGAAFCEPLRLLLGKLVRLGHVRQDRRRAGRDPGSEGNSMREWSRSLPAAAIASVGARGAVVGEQDRHDLLFAAEARGARSAS